MMFAPLGDSAVVVTLGTSIDKTTLLRVRSLAAEIERQDVAGIVDVVPAYTTVTVFYNLGEWGSGDAPPFERVCHLISRIGAMANSRFPEFMQRKSARAAELEKMQTVEIPVCYGGECGPDIEAVARHCGLAPDAVIALHSGADYVVHAVGFLPGFPYLGGLPDALRTPRRPSPRVKVPAGSVGIGWAQTGVYPMESPGGWQLIGRTPLVLFRATDEPPALLRVGDQVKFHSISPEEFAAWK